MRGGVKDDGRAVGAEDGLDAEAIRHVADEGVDLGVGDEGIIFFRKLLREQIELVRNGREPLGLIRNPSENRLIEFDVVNERIGLYGRERKKVA